MKKIVAIAMLFIMSGAFVLYETYASETNIFLPNTLGDQVIVVDPGHGGMDGGASNGEVVEKDITLALGKVLKQKLENRGAKVVMTRSSPGDAIGEDERYTSLRARKLEDLRYRLKLAHDANATLFVSIHVNAVPQSKWRGAQVFYHKTGHEESGAIAKSIQASIRTEMKNTNREALAIKQVYLLKKANVPAVLVETGFISNDEERALLMDEKYRERMVEAIVQGIENYFEAKRF